MFLRPRQLTGTRLALTALVALACLAGCVKETGPVIPEPDREPTYVTTDTAQLKSLHEAWADRGSFPPLERLDYHIPGYAGFLKGMKICLDPGHGGDAAMKGYKRGPTEFREAIMNRKVAGYLRAFLEQCGAEVKLTVEDDVDVSLRERCRIANEWGADLFVSIHHNAAGPKANRTVTFFHGHPDYEPANLDLARNIQIGVAEALRLPQTDGVPVKSDYLMYDNAGFGVLRNLRTVGCLCEASFFTNPYEEYRLKQDEYLKHEAYGYFLGFARYAWMGVPRAVLLQPAPGGEVESKQPLIEVKADTGFSTRANWGSDKPWIFSDSVVLRVDGAVIPHEYDKAKGVISARPKEPLAAGKHVVVAGYRNHQGNYAHPVPLSFTVAPPLETLTLFMLPTGDTPATPTLTGDTPASPSLTPTAADAPATLTLVALDKDGDPILDGTEFRLASDAVSFSTNPLYTKNGKALTRIVKIVPAKSDEPVVIRVEGKFGSASIALQKPFTTPFIWRK